MLPVYTARCAAATGYGTSSPILRTPADLLLLLVLVIDYPPTNLNRSHPDQLGTPFPKA